MGHKLYISFFYVLTLLMLNGCLFGNGDTYGNIPTSADAGSKPMPNSIVPNDYYLLDPAYHCIPVGHTSTDPSIPSYRDHIVVASGQVTSLGDRCKAQNIEIKSDEISYSADRRFLFYKDSIYTYSAEPPTEARLTQKIFLAYCKSNDYSPTFDLNILEKLPNGELNLVEFNYFEKPEARGFSMVMRRNEESGQDIFETEATRLSIIKADASRETAGQIKLILEGKSVEVSTSCRYF